MTTQSTYPIGQPGIPWSTTEKQQWLAAQQRRRSYQDDVVNSLVKLKTNHADVLHVEQYGMLDYSPHSYPLMLARTQAWNKERPTILITGGVHGYETSGVHGALRFIDKELGKYAQDFNFVVAPCISPWAYETINRWNPAADDPNRSFSQDRSTPESAALMSYLDSLQVSWLAHIDLHETTDTDNSEFRPALEARDGIKQELWEIPDGFYCVGDTLKPAPEFQAAIIRAVAEVTHIAEADASNKHIGSNLEQYGVINYPKRALGLCAGFTSAEYVSTTEVYPDSPRVSDENCIVAQVAAITGALNYLLGVLRHVKAT